MSGPNSPETPQNPITPPASQELVSGNVLIDPTFLTTPLIMTPALSTETKPSFAQQGTTGSSPPPLSLHDSLEISLTGTQFAPALALAGASTTLIPRAVGIAEDSVEDFFRGSAVHITLNSVQAANTLKNGTNYIAKTVTKGELSNLVKLDALEGYAGAAAGLFVVNETLDAKDGQELHTFVKGTRNALLTGVSMQIAKATAPGLARTGVQWLTTNAPHLFEEGNLAGKLLTRAMPAAGETAEVVEVAGAGEGLLAAAGVLGPVLTVAAPALFLYHDWDIGKVRHQFQLERDKIQLDTSGHSNLQKIADEATPEKIDNYRNQILAQKGTRELSLHEQAFLDDHFTRDAQGRINASAPENLKPLTDYIAAQREQVAQAIADKDQITRPDGMLFKGKLIAQLIQENAMHRLDIASQELDAVKMQNTPSLQNALPQAGKAPGTVENVSYLYEERDDSRFGDVKNRIHQTSDASPKLPPKDVISEYEANMQRGTNFTIQRSYTHDGFTENVTWAIRNAHVPLVSMTQYQPLWQSEANQKAHELSDQFKHAEDALIASSKSGNERKSTAAQNALVNAYEQYRGQLQYLKENAQTLGMTDKDLQKADRSIKQEMADFNHTFAIVQSNNMTHSDPTVPLPSPPGAAKVRSTGTPGS